MDSGKTIVAGIDFSDASRAALRQAVRLAARMGARVRAVHVVERSMLEEVASSMQIEPDLAIDRITSHTKFGIQKIIEEARSGMSGASPEVVHEVVTGSAAGELVRVAGEGAALLVLGTFGQGHPRGGVGTTAAKCVRHSSTDVLLVRPDAEGPFKRVVACTDFSDTAARAMREGVALARGDGAEVHALHVFAPPPPLYPPADLIGLWPIPAPEYAAMAATLRDNAKRALGEAITSLGRDAEGVRVVQAVVEDPSYSRAICHYARHMNADLVVIGTHGRTNLRYILLGSTAEKVLHEVGCSVLAIKPERALHH